MGVLFYFQFSSLDLADRCLSVGRWWMYLQDNTEQAADCAPLLILMHLSYYLVQEATGSLTVDRTVFLLIEHGSFLCTGCTGLSQAEAL